MSKSIFLTSRLLYEMLRDRKSQISNRLTIVQTSPCDRTSGMEIVLNSVMKGL
ncbi:MAG: hypothetical protein V7L05_34470 [Nostoc sp.]|uniref:hypothetical protein n=1 Tax=Nostoc sp. TaxID=1180 RepID=UPI002FF6988E